ncbi:divisome protein SepX/GlpR [Nonomuraea sp. 3N208]|uniref:divisome protein SepX/GlpR n=1 Tax=Nonomuraea sp. 3N208 TaxID=3457421 RepID=UPI003FD4D99F
MSSVLLYLAIVVMWLCVLIPMWLRKDKTNLAELAELEEYYTGEHQLPDLDNLEPPSAEGSDEDDAAPPPSEVEKVDVRQFRLRRRAIIVARRRRLLFFTTLLVLASVVTAAVQMIPWWGVAPSIVIMLAYMGFLRVAVQVDGERRARAREARAERLRRTRERRRVVEEPPAEVIELASLHQDVLFDQYAEPPRRAVGD